MNLQKITDRVYFIQNNTNIGVLKDGDDVVLVDSGLDKQAAKKILNIIKENGWTIQAIINTHSHADHCGGNQYLKKQQPLKIYAPEIEEVWIENPILEPSALFSGAYPIKDLQHKFLMAEESKVDYSIQKDEKIITIGNLEVGIVPLYGHSVSQIGVELDGVLFCSDAVFDEQIIEKHDIVYCTDVAAWLETLNILKTTTYRYYVGSHANITDNILNLAELNEEMIENMANLVLESVKTPKTTEEVMQHICNHFNIQIDKIQKYYLTKTPIMAYLSYLYNRKEVEIQLTDNKLYWEKK